MHLRRPAVELQQQATHEFHLPIKKMRADAEYLASKELRWRKVIEYSTLQSKLKITSKHDHEVTSTIQYEAGDYH